MNIAAYMAACDVWDLDRNAKDALRAVCGRVDYPSGIGEVPIGRVAADMKVHVNTARPALQRVVEAGYLTVDNRPGRTPVWRVNPYRLVVGVPLQQPLQPGCRTPLHPGWRTKDLLDREGGAAAPPSSGGRAGDNPASRGSRFYPGTGWVQPINGT